MSRSWPPCRLGPARSAIQRAAAVVALACAGAAHAAPEVRYRVSFEHAAAHRVDLQVTVDEAPSPLELTMPVWTPGAYERRDWGRNAVARGAADEAGRALRLERSSAGGFRVSGHPAGARVTVRYQVHAELLSDDASQVDARHAYLNGTSIFLRAHGCDGRLHRVQIDAPEGAKVASVLDEGSGTLAAPSYEALVDAPIEVGRFSEARVESGGRSIEVAIDAVDGAAAQEEVPRKLLDDLGKLVRAESAIAGPPAWRRYLLLVHLADGPGRIAALEHAASSSLVVPRRSLADPDGYRELTYIVAHELFHAWNARRLRPRELVPLDFDQPQPSRALWITEGLTEYFAHRAMLAAGLWTQREYLDHVAEEAARVWNDPAAAELSLEEEAELTWHAPDAIEGDPDAYYARGHLVALGLDAQIRARTAGRRTLADALRSLIAQADRAGGVLPVDEPALAKAASAAAGADLAPLVDGWARRPGLPSLAEALKSIGLAIEAARGEAESGLGLAVEWDHGSPRVAQLAPDGAAARAGLRPGDRVLSVDGAPPPERWPEGAFARAGRLIDLEVVRATRHLRLSLAPAPRRPFQLKLVPLPGAAPAARTLRDAWLRGS